MSQSQYNRDEALSTLEVGFVRKASEKSSKKIVKEDPEASVEAIIKKALKTYKKT
jgi:Holliday junction DNA helicase RuvA